MADRVRQQLGNYRVVHKLGEGGFAEAYLGVHIHLGTQAALKVLKTGLANKQEIEQFRTEARTIANLVHRHIVRVLDFDVEQGTPFLVMDYAPNGSLRQRHPKGTRLPLDAIVAYVKQVAEALQFAHSQRLIHRDIKPENLLLGRNNEVLLSDFGIVVVAQSTSRMQTQGFAGTTAYSAPEQLMGKPQLASDQYALGIVVYEWLCGELPFQGNQMEVAFQHAQAPVPPLKDKVSSLPPAVEQAVLKVLAKEPKQRFGSVQEFADALAQANSAGLTILSAPTLVRSPSASDANPLAPTIPAQKQPPGTTLYVNPDCAAQFIVWSPDDTCIAIIRHDGKFQIWAVADMRRWIFSYSDPIFRPHSVSMVPMGISWSPDSKHIAFISQELYKEGYIRRVSPQEIKKAGNKRRRLGSIFEEEPIVKADLYIPEYHFIDLFDTSNLVRMMIHSDDLFRIWRTHKIWIDPPGTRRVDSRGVLSPDDLLVASGVNDEIRIWDGEDRDTPLWAVAVRLSKIIPFAWAPNSKYIASEGVNNTIQVWDARDGKLLATYRGHLQPIAAFAWSSDSTRIASSGGHQLHIWQAI